MRNVVWYHENCMDGACAAWVASQYLDPRKTEYIAQSYGKPIRKCTALELPDKETIILYILDWCPEAMDKLYELCGKFEKVVLIDHHDSAIRKFVNYTEYNTVPANLHFELAYKNEWSGAMGTAKYFADNTRSETDEGSEDLTEHWLVQAVDDRDRWVFALPGSREIHESLLFRGFDWRAWDIDSASSMSQRDKAIEQGKVMLAIQEKHVDKIIAAAAYEFEDFNDHTSCMICNCPYAFISDVGNKITDNPQYRVAVMWYQTADRKIYFSFRSKKSNSRAVDCGKLASLLGGGGHVNAAGTTIDLPQQLAMDKLWAALDKVL